MLLLVTLADALIPELRARFPGRGLRAGSPPEPCAVFPAVHLDVGDIEIVDDGCELTVYAGRFTHGHFECYDPNTREPERTEQIVSAVVAFLERLFADQIVLWGSHEGCGGWYARDSERSGNVTDEIQELTGGDPPKLYVWSGPLG